MRSALPGNSLAAYPTGTAGSVRGVEKRAVFRKNRNYQPMQRALLLLSISVIRSRHSTSFSQILRLPNGLPRFPGIGAERQISPQLYC
jgi:hypothetical protein